MASQKNPVSFYLKNIEYRSVCSCTITKLTKIMQPNGCSVAISVPKFIRKRQMTPRTCIQRTLCSRSHFCSSIFNGLFLSFQHSGINIFSAFFLNKPWRIFRNSAVELKLQFMKLLACILIFCYAGFLSFDLSDSLFNGNCKNLYNFCHIDFIGWYQADSFFMFTFSFSEIFVYPDFIFHTFFSFWIFICIYPDHFSLSIFIWNPTAIPNSIFKELFQFMIQNLFHQLILSWKSISVFFLHQSLMIHLWSFHLESILLFPLFIIVIMNDFCFHYQSSIFFKSFIFLWYLFIYQLSI